MKKRAFIIVLDSVGIGALPDAADFGDAGADTLGNILRERGVLNIPNMYKMGLGNIDSAKLPPVESPSAAYGRAIEITKAKDTTCGHWEMAGLLMDNPFRVFPNGFPREVMDEFEKRIGRKTLANYPASGTAIIQELGDEHVKTGFPIVYTSADSVFQIAAHEDVIPLDELYRMCEIARELLCGDYFVGRVIARPFKGESGNYYRTENRKDYAVEPTKETILDGLFGGGYTTVAVGKIEDIFAHRGISIVDHTKNNVAGIDATVRIAKEGTGDFVFVNLVDFDMLYGHRNDVEGYAKALEYFDSRLPEITDSMHDGDLLIITADHGCDPTHPGTDHTREYIPILVTGKGLDIKCGNIGTRESFADIGATVFEYITGRQWTTGASFLGQIL